MTVVINGNTGISGTNGSAGTPAVQGEDTNTGLFFPAADTVAVATGGSERLRVDASGNFGVGTTAPSDYNAAADNLVVGTTSGHNGITIASGSANQGSLFFADGTASSAEEAAGFLFYEHASNYMAFGTNNTERARIDASGNLLVGTTTDIGAKLVAKSSGSAGSLNSFIAINSSGTVLLQVRDDGLITTSTAGAGPYALTTASAANMVVTSGGEFRRSTSSLKYKTDVQNATNGLEKVLALRPVTYKGVNDGTTVFGGLIAEEVHDAGLTEFVQYADDGTPDALAYGQMVSLAFKAIQEQQAIIADLTARVAALEAK